jgi:hypothetical protein
MDASTTSSPTRPRRCLAKSRYVLMASRTDLQYCHWLGCTCAHGHVCVCVRVCVCVCVCDSFLIAVLSATGSHESTGIRRHVRLGFTTGTWLHASVSPGEIHDHGHSFGIHLATSLENACAQRYALSPMQTNDLPNLLQSHVCIVEMTWQDNLWCEITIPGNNRLTLRNVSITLACTVRQLFP